jgi:hypothetical protein
MLSLVINHCTIKGGVLKKKDFLFNIDDVWVGEDLKEILSSLIN